MKNERATISDNTAEVLRSVPVLELLVFAVTPSTLCKEGDQTTAQGGPQKAGWNTGGTHEGVKKWEQKGRKRKTGSDFKH